MKEYDVVGIGSSLMDVVMFPRDIAEITVAERDRVKNYLAVENSTKRNVEKMKMTPGGSAANTCYSLALLGLRTAFFAKLGDDLYGHAIAEQLASVGVDVSGIHFTDKASTGMSIVLMTPDQKDRSILSYKGANDLISPDDIPDKIKTRAMIWTSLVPRNAIEAIKKLIRITRENKGFVVAGPSITIIRGNPEGARECVGLSDYCVCNMEEARALSGKETIDEIIEYIFELGLKGILITNGGKGSYLVLKDGTRLKAGVFNVKVEDTTGAGDATLAGFVYGLLNGYDPRMCMALAAANSAFEVQELGVREGLPDADGLLKFVKERIDELDIREF